MHNVTDDNQAAFFNSGKGIPNSYANVKAGDTINLIGTFSDRTFRINIPVNIVGSNCLLKNCRFFIAEGASGSNLTGLHIVNDNSFGILFEASNCTLKDSSIYSTGPSSYNIILNTNACYNTIINNYLKAGSYKEESLTKSVSNIVVGGAHHNYIANNYLEFEDANSIYLSQWGSNYFDGGISNYNVIFNNTLKCVVVPTSWCYAIQIYGSENRVDSNRVIGAYRGISGDDNTTIVNNVLVNLTGKDYTTYSLTGAEFGIITGSNSIIQNNTIKNSVIFNSAVYGGSHSTISNNHIDVSGNAHGIEAMGDDINVSDNVISVTSGSGIYQVGKYSGLFIANNNITATFGIGILLKKSVNKNPTNVTIINNNIATYNKYSINIKDVKGLYIVLDNNCNSMILTPDSESGTLNNTCYIINISGTFDDLAEALEIIEDGGIINLTGDIHLMGIGSTDASGIVISKSVIIEGNNFEINAHERCVRVFNITETANVTLKNLLFHGCYLLYDDYYAESLEGVEEEYTGGVIYNTGNLTIINSTFIANKANIGGAIYNGGNLDITDSSFRNNQAISKRIYTWEEEDDGINFIKSDGGGGGAIYSDGYLNIKNTVFHNNLAESSTGAIYSDGVLYMDGCLVFSNKASGPAAACGAIYTSNNATINNSKFLDNRASQGGVIVSNGANLVIENSDLSQNLVFYDHFGGSGGVIMGDGNIKLINSNFTGNTCQYAGGVLYTGTGYGTGHANILVDGCNFDQNFGGAIYNVASGTLNVVDSVFTKNKGSGAAIYNNGATMVIDGTVFDGNIGGTTVTSNAQSNTFVNSKVTNNINAYASGTIYLGGNSIVDNSSFIANSVKGYGGGLFVNDATITNSEFINNTASKGSGVYMNHRLRPSESFNNGVFDENGNYNVVVKPADNPTQEPESPDTNTSNSDGTDTNPSQGSDNPNPNGGGSDDNGGTNSEPNLDNGDVTNPTQSDQTAENSASTNSSNVADSSDVGEIQNAVSPQSSASSSSGAQSSAGESASQASQNGESKAYELNKKVSKRAASDSTPLIVSVIGAIILVLLLIIGYKRGKNDEL